MPKFPGFIGGSNTSSAFSLDCERTVNLYVEGAQAQAAKNGAALIGTPGFIRWNSTPTHDIGGRGAIYANGRRFVVIGAGVYEFSSTGVATKLGPVVQDSNPAQFAYNGRVGGQIGLCSGGNVYAINMSTTPALLGGPYFAGATISHLAYSQGYGLGFDSNTGRVYLSALNDFSTWSLGTFFQRSLFADAWRAMFVDQNSLAWMLGDESFEVWNLSNPSSTQPFAPLSGLNGRFGIVAPFAYGVSSAGGFWLSRSQEGGAQMVQSRGSSPQSVGTYAVNTAIAGYRRTSKISDAEMLIYFDAGHTFVNLSFPSARATWTFDVESRSWAERGQWKSADKAYDVWAPRVHIDDGTKHLVGDRTSGYLWVMDSQYATDVDGAGIRRLRRAPALTVEHQRVPFDQFELLMDVGLGTPTGQGADPKVMLRVSQNNGRTFGNELARVIGRAGEYGTRAAWNRLGVGPDTVLELSWSDPVPVRVVDAWLNNLERSA